MSELATGLLARFPPTLRRSDWNPARPSFGQRPARFSCRSARIMRRPFEPRLTRAPAPLSRGVVAGDPEEDARLILASGLTYTGYRVRLAGTGDELLREARGGSVGGRRLL